MRNDRLYLLDMRDACEAIQRFLTGCTEQQFLADERTQAAVLHKLVIIGEAANHLSETLRQGHPNIPWNGIRAFRNHAVHAYFSGSSGNRVGDFW